MWEIGTEVALQSVFCQHSEKGMKVRGSVHVPTAPTGCKEYCNICSLWVILGGWGRDLEGYVCMFSYLSLSFAFSFPFFLFYYMFIALGMILKRYNAQA